MADVPAEQYHRPLTAAELEVLEEWMAERREKLEEEINARIAAAVEPLQATIAQLQAQAVQVGTKIALRAANGKIMCAAEGGPTTDDKPFTFVSRSSVQSWESFNVERGV